MTEARPTLGVRIKSIALHRSSFEWQADAEQERQAATLPEAQRPQTASMVVRSAKERIAGTEVVVSLTVTLDGRVGEIPFWRLEATFRGEFLVAPDAEITAEQVAEIHGPAWLYSAAREYVADVTRRTKVGAGLILSPFHFAKSSSE